LKPLGFEVRAREPIFAILGDPVRRPGFHLRDSGLWLTWRILSKGIRVLPPRLRDPIGALAARCLTPVDTGLRRLGWSRGINLEFVVFELKA
jgi:hypothetical protein